MNVPSLRTAIAVVFVFTAASANAQVALAGAWKCANDAGNGVPQAMPPKSAQIAAGTQYFAPKGSLFEVALAKGGPKGLFVFGHLHGIHNDRTGYTNYGATAFIRDDGGYYYAVLPALTTQVKGQKSKPQKHQHCGAQFVFPSPETQADLDAALKAGATITLQVGASRKRTDGFTELGEHLAADAKKLVGEFLNGKISASALLSKLNVGKSPKK